MADRSRVSILLLMLVSACRSALTGLSASALHASFLKPQRCLSIA